MAPGYLELWKESRQMQAKVETAPPRGEWSLTDPILYPKGGKSWSYNPDIFASRKGGMRLYDTMRRDSMIKACQWIKRLAVLCSGWTVEPASDTEGVDQEAATFVKEVFTELKGTLEETIKQILSGMDYGYSVSEKIWHVIPEGDFKGKWGYKAVKTRKPHEWQFDMDEYGNLQPNGLWQLSGQYKYDPKKFVVYSHNGEFQNWYGTSDLQAAYSHWWSKDVIMRFWNVYLEKFGMGIPYLRPGEGKSAIPEPVYTELKNAIFNLQGTSAIATQSADAIVEILESKRRGKDEYLGAIQYHDRSMARALLMPSGLGFAEDEKSGSLARSRKHFDLWLWIMNDLRGTSEETIMQEQLVRPLVDFNYSVKKYPLFKFNPLEDEESTALAKLWLEAIEGRAVHPGAEDENHFRKMIRFPEKDVEELDEQIELESTKRPSGLPPAWPGMGWELQKTEIKPENPEAVPEKEPVPAALQPGQQPLDPNKVIPFPPPKEHARTWHRELTPYEKRVDFAAVEKALDDLEAETRSRLVAILEKQRDNLVAKIERAGDKVNKNWVRSLKLKYGTEFQSTVGAFINETFKLGQVDARVEVARAKGQGYATPVIKLPPNTAIKRLMEDRFWIKNVTFDSLTKAIQALLISMLDSGEVPGETLQKIKAAYEPYIGDEQVVRDQKQIEPYRIETLIRTNATKAYNTGKMVEYNDPDLKGFVRAVQLSAILDTRTTAICQDADGKIVMMDDPNAGSMVPPLHHNCRTVAIPVTEADGAFEPSKQSSLAGVRSKMPKDFGGNLDRG